MVEKEGAAVVLLVVGLVLCHSVCYLLLIIVVLMLCFYYVGLQYIDEQTQFHEACANGQTDIVRELMKKVDVNHIKVWVIIEKATR